MTCGEEGFNLICVYDNIELFLQVNPAKYRGIISSFGTTIREEGFRGLGKGWAPTFVGYSLQGLGKFGFYEVFKLYYSELLGEVCFAFLYVIPTSPSLLETVTS